MAGISEYKVVARVGVKAASLIDPQNLQADLLAVHVEYNEMVGAQGRLGARLHHVFKLDFHSAVGFQVIVQRGFALASVERRGDRFDRISLLVHPAHRACQKPGYHY